MFYDESTCEKVAFRRQLWAPKGGQGALAVANAPSKRYAMGSLLRYKKLRKLLHFPTVASKHRHAQQERQQQRQTPPPPLTPTTTTTGTHNDTDSNNDTTATIFYTNDNDNGINDDDSDKTCRHLDSVGHRVLRRRERPVQLHRPLLRPRLRAPKLKRDRLALCDEHATNGKGTASKRAAWKRQQQHWNGPTVAWGVNNASTQCRRRRTATSSPCETVLLACFAVVSALKNTFSLFLRSPLDTNRSETQNRATTALTQLARIIGRENSSVSHYCCYGTNGLRYPIAFLLARAACYCCAPTDSAMSRLWFSLLGYSRVDSRGRWLDSRWWRQACAIETNYVVYGK